MYYDIKEYISPTGKSYFKAWFATLSIQVAYKITAALYKMEQGNFSNTKSVGGGVWEFKIDSGPGYRVYFAKIGKNMMLLLAGGTKRGQNKDIQLATELLKNYKKKTLH